MRTFLGYGESTFVPRFRVGGDLYTEQEPVPYVQPITVPQFIPNPQIHLNPMQHNYMQIDNLQEIINELHSMHNTPESSAGSRDGSPEPTQFLIVDTLFSLHNRLKRLEEMHLT